MIRALRGVAGTLHRSATALKNLAYDRNLLHARRLNASVISVGNIALGGTGKTPVCSYLCEELRRAGFRPAVLLRGYSTGQLSDEARLHALHLGKASVFAGADRLATGWQALAAGHDVIILDDGFQHRQLHRDCDIVLVDCTDPWAKQWWLREGPRSLRRAQILLLTRWKENSAGEIEKELARLAPGADLFRVRFAPVETLAGKSVYAFCGIGNPAAFLETIGEAGGRVLGRSFFKDHYEFSPRDLRELRAAADLAKADMLLTTKKDAARLSADQVREFRISTLSLRTDVSEGFTESVLRRIGRRT